MVYTATVGAMLANNMALPMYGGTITSVAAGQRVSNTSIGAFNTIAVLAVYGTTVSTVVSGNGAEKVYNGGKTSSTRVYGYSTDGGNYGSQIIYSGGIASNTTVDWYGRQFVSSGGVVKNAKISSGGTQYLRNGTASNTSVLYGTQYVSNGGKANTVVLSAV